MSGVVAHFPARPHPCCQVGDLAVAKTDRGYSVARVIALAGPGPSWELVATIVDFKSAIALALQLADAAGARAWIPTSAGLCEQIPPKLAR